ncbi:MAG TPA: class I SAM-dependent methyltransferase [Thermoanaerobaculia bacterium]|nr:class I SAM-dependent methyltransferase [Thermoanaerobaculia bacterium]
MNELRQTAAFWDREHSAAEFRTWMEHPLVRSAINRRIGGSREMWPLDWFSELIAPRTFERALSIGCGTGALERDLIRRGLCRSVDALDASLQSVAEAARLAALDEFGESINYFVGDFNRLSLPRARYDLVLFHQSLHHVDELEALLSTVMRSLTSKGLLFLDEYTGPSRTSWTPRRFAYARCVYDRLPPSIRLHQKLPLPIHPFDPSEAIRSDEILHRTRIGFETISERPYGGNLLAPIYPGLTAASDETIASLLEEEDIWLAEHRDSHYRIVVAKPRRGVRGLVAATSYAVLAALHAAGLARGVLAARRFARRVWIALDRRIRRKPIDHYS